MGTAEKISKPAKGIWTLNSKEVAESELINEDDLLQETDLLKPKRIFWETSHVIRG
jgi:hypothetical protein